MPVFYVQKSSLLNYDPEQDDRKWGQDYAGFRVLEYIYKAKQGI